MARGARARCHGWQIFSPEHRIRSLKSEPAIKRAPLPRILHSAVAQAVRVPPRRWAHVCTRGQDALPTPARLSASIRLHEEVQRARCPGQKLLRKLETLSLRSLPPFPHRYPQGTCRTTILLARNGRLPARAMYASGERRVGKDQWNEEKKGRKEGRKLEWVEREVGRGTDEKGEGADGGGCAFA